MKDSYVARMMFLACNTDYKGMIVERDKNVRSIFARWDTLGAMLGVGSREIGRFREAAENKYIKADANGNLRLVAPCFRRGKLTEKYVTDASIHSRNILRMYSPAVRSLYDAATGRQKSMLCYIYKLLPYVSHKYNVLCWDASENDIGSIQPLKFTELCDVVGYGKTHSAMVRKMLFDPEYRIRSNKEHAFVVDPYNSCFDGPCIYLNPHIMCGGTKESAEIAERHFNN